MAQYLEEDVGNVVLLEHVNVRVPDQSLATAFYVVGLGLTRDPYLNVGLSNMWINAGEQQFHLPTGAPQVIDGCIGLVVPDLGALKERLAAVEEALRGTQFAWQLAGEQVAARCPWGNRFLCHASGPRFGDMGLGLPYVEFRVRPGDARAIGRFYSTVFGAPVRCHSGGRPAAEVQIGCGQALIFKESDEPIRPYDGHHVAVYVANFSGPYGWLRERGLIVEDVSNHQFRFQRIVDPESGADLFALEHEVRSLRHPMFRRPFINRDPAQSQRRYRRGRDSLIPFAS